MLLVRNAVREDELQFLLRERTTWKVASDTGAADANGRHTMVFNAQSRRTDVDWCQKGCANEHIMRKFLSRVSEMVRVHSDYFEQMQRAHPPDS